MSVRNSILIQILFTIIPLYAQVSLQKEEFVGNQYRLHYINKGYTFETQIILQQKYISFGGKVENVEDIQYPTQEIIIALPPNTQPKIRFTVVKDQSISEDKIANSPKNLNCEYRFKGYLWIENYYCAHLEVNPFWFDSKSNTIKELQEFRIDVDLPSASINKEFKKSNSSVSKSIDNIQFADQWKSKQSGYTVSPTDSWIHYDQQYVKIGVVEDGIYRIKYNDLVSYGLPALINPKKLKIYLKGNEIPIYVTGQADPNHLSFNSEDYIEFIGLKNYGDKRYREIAPFDSSYYEYLNRYSDTTIYWLNWSGEEGKRVDTTISVIGISTDTLLYYDQLIHAEKNAYWDWQLSGGAVRQNFPELLENETWNDIPFGVGTSPVTFVLSNIFPNKPARAFLKIQDYSSNLGANAHNVALSINSTITKYDSGFIDKFQGKVLKAMFLSSVLVNGTNTVDGVMFAVANNSVNSVFRDWTELEYPRYLSTTTDSLSFAYRNLVSSTFSTVLISGLSGNTFSLYKLNSNNNTIIKITNFSRSFDTLRFNDTIINGLQYFLLRENKIQPPIFFYKKQFSNLRQVSNKADYIAITHPVFLSSASSYATFIANTYGVTAKVVNIDDIYDEFNYGFFSPEPIKEFLKSTQVYWQSPKPKYVFLIGKGTYDYYGNKTKYFGVPATMNYVPPYGNPVSDTWFVQWDSTGSLIPQMNIGRLPARNINEFQSYFAKHQKYVSKGFDDWNKRYIFFSGGNITDLNQLAQSKGVNDFIINNYVNPTPIGGNSINFYKTPSPNLSNFGPYDPDFIKNNIDNGGVFISYIGHSGTQTWDNSITDISQLSNIRDRNPMISDFGCSTGKFAESDVYSFSELAVSNTRGQAIAYIGNSSLGFTSTAYSFPQVFYRNLLIDTSATIGDVHRLAKIAFMKQNGSSSSYGLFVKTNTLLGDPIVKLPIPTKPNFSFTNSTITIVPERPTDQYDSLLLNVPYFNLGTVVSDSIGFSIKVESQNSIVSYKTMKRKIPLFQDSLILAIPIKGKSGQYTITIICDSANTLDEIYENDNSIMYQTVVSSTNIKNLTIASLQNQTSKKIKYLNPSIKPSLSSFYVDISLNNFFIPKTSKQIQYDTFSTVIALDSIFYNKRIWIRSKFDALSSEGLSYSYFMGDKDNYYLNDSLAFSTIKKNALKYSEHTLRLDTTKIALQGISGGFNDGNNSAILKNSENFIPEGTLSGFHVCVFDGTTFDFKGYYHFDVQASLSISANFKTLLDTLNSGYIVIVTITNDVASSGGSNFPASLKTSLKQYGSKYIDSVSIADSWVLIGRKGALQGSVPEKYSKRYAVGFPISIDTTIISPNHRGTFLTQNIGPVGSWSTIETKYTATNGSNIKLGLIGIKNDQTVDTLQQFTVTDTLRSISSVNSIQYPYIKLFGELNSGVGNISPTFSSIAINYQSLPELGTNYQVFKGYHIQNNVPSQEIASTDTIIQGEKVQLKYRVYNAGGTTAKNIPIKLTSQWDNNYTELITSQTIDSIPPDSYKEISTQYNTSLGSGRRNILLIIDPDTTIREIYKDNNFYSYPIIIKKSAGNPLLPNLFISQNAVSTTPSPITDETDTAKFSIIYGNSGSLVNDSISIQVKHFYFGNLITTQIIRRKYPVSYDTVNLKIPIVNNSGEHQLSVDLDYNGLIVESSESDNSSTYYFTVVTTDFKVLFPSSNSISSVNQITFLNPTISTGINSTVSLEIDTLSNYSTAKTFSKQLQEFISSFPLPGLKTLKRYYWRVKIVNSGRDWTTGSFYSGDSTTVAFGQLDSVSWNQNTFQRTAYFLDNGARIIDTKNTITAISAGFNDGNSGSITIAGVNVITPILGSGHNIVVVDSNSFKVVSLRRFNVTANPDESDSLIQYISTVANGSYVIDVVVDEGANNLTQTARNILKSIGSKFIDQVSFRDSWAIIGRKGATVGSVPEIYKVQSTGTALVETTIVRAEKSGVVETPLIGPFTSISNMTIDEIVPVGAQLKVQFVGINSSNNYDTLLTSINQNIISLSSINSKKYRNGKIVFSFLIPSSIRNQRSIAAVASPVVMSWRITATSPTELAASSQSSVINRNQVMEGEVIQFSGKVFNVSNVIAESVMVQLKTNASGIATILKQQRFSQILPNDSVSFSFAYDTRGKRGNHAFTFEIDPLDSLSEQMKSNNSVTIPYIVQADTLRPTLQLTFNGTQVVNGDYVEQHPEIRIHFTDNNPANLLPSDSSNFKIKLNNAQVPFNKGIAELLTTNSIGKAEVRWTPELAAGENIIEVSAKDLSENYSDTILLYVNVATEFRIMDIFNLPNPFNSFTHFTFNLAGPTTPDEVIIKIYTVAGRLIQEISTIGNIGFNKIPWDGRDKDGDQIGNGVYLYKVIVKQGGKQVEGLSKLVKMR